MPAKILDGKKIAEEINQELKAEIEELAKKNIVPGLAVILVGTNPASKIYVDSKKNACSNVGIESRDINFPETVSQTELIGAIKELNDDKSIHGILIQLPLPKHINRRKIIGAISKDKDVDCFGFENFGEMALGKELVRFKPCTPQGIIELLKRSEVSVEGKECVIVGRSNLVGKPLALLLLQEGGTVTICHSKTKNLAQHCRRADILVSAVGKTGIITKEMVKPGAVVADVGINRNKNGKIAGDVDFEGVKSVASAITPVPGGVGPMTIAQLLKNTVVAAKRAARITS